MTLYTDDLVLRTVDVSDVREVARMWTFEKGCILADEAQKAIETMRDNHKKNRTGHIHHLCLAIFEKDAERIIGWCGLDGKTAGKLHIFYFVDKDYRNRGYATQCAGRLLSYAFDEAHVPFVNGGCDKDNAPSYKVMMKIGMRQSGFEANGDPVFWIDGALYCKNRTRLQKRPTPASISCHKNLTNSSCKTRIQPL